MFLMYKLMSLYNFSVFITAVPSLQLLFLRSFFLSTIAVQYISHLKQKVVVNNTKTSCLYFCM